VVPSAWPHGQKEPSGSAKGINTVFCTNKTVVTRDVKVFKPVWLEGQNVGLEAKLLASASKPKRLRPKILALGMRIWTRGLGFV